MKGIQPVANLSEHVGYRNHLKPYIISNINKLEDDLAFGDFESLEELKETQAALKAYRSVLSFVDKRVEKRIEEAKNG